MPATIRIAHTQRAPARRYGHDGVVMTLLELGADPAASADDGRTPLHAACMGGFEVPMTRPSRPRNNIAADIEGHQDLLILPCSP
jgi:hypothetical protein